MDNSKKIATSVAMMLCLWGLPFMSTQSSAHAKSQVTLKQTHLQQLNQLWLAYQDQILIMESAIDKLKNQIDETQKNATISLYMKKIDQTKTALNRLILTESKANLLRQQMIEHATKYQNSYRLATTNKHNSHQLNMVQRLTSQTDELYHKMQLTALELYS